MKGSPLLRGILVLIALLTLLLPLRSLTTHPSNPATAPGKPLPLSGTGVHLALLSTTFPFTFSVSHLGKVIWEGESSGDSATKDVMMNFPEEGIDLSVEVKWGGEKNTAVKLEVTPKQGEPITRTLWGRTGVNDVLTFQPKE